MLNENELVTAEITRLRRYADQFESSLVIEVEDLFWFGHFEGISADPIDHVAPQRHSPQGLVVPKGTERSAHEQVRE